MPFELRTPTAAMLKTVTPRTEIHGDEPVSAISLGLSITGPNTLLDALDGGKLRHAPFGEAQRGEGWPFPQTGGEGVDGGADSEGGHTDASSDAAEFEAGAAAAIEKATGGRRGKRTRASVE